MKKILIEGDSWCFCWDVQSCGFRFEKPLKSKAFSYYHAGDPYLEKLLWEAGHEAKTTGKGGSSNAMVIDRLWAHDSTDYDLIIILQTSPLRDLDTEKKCSAMDPGYMKSIKDTIGDKTPDEYNAIVQGYAYDYYKKLYDVALSKYPNSQFLLMGGNSKIDPDTWNRFQNDHPNSRMHVLHHSLLEMLQSHVKYDFNQIGSREPICDLVHHTESGFANWNSHVDETWNWDLIDYLYDSEINIHRSLMKTYMFTVPDNGHLNRNSYLYVADDILCWMEENL